MKWDNWMSPIQVMQKQIQVETEGHIMKAIQEVGVVVDKQELIRCMSYDRNQYENGYQQGRKDAIEFISDKLIYPLLNEYDRGLWEHINYIELAEEWIKVLDDNPPYLKFENRAESIKRDLRQWIAEQMKGENK